MSWKGPAILFDSGSGLKIESSNRPYLVPPAQPGTISSLSDLKHRVEDRLRALILAEAFVPKNLLDAMSHALMGGGKRFRPLFFVCMTQRQELEDAAIDIGCAVEMVHTASLILDDLPCMDNADLRRRQETTHRAFGQATAILAAISLLARGFNIISSLRGIPPDLRAELVGILTRAVGHTGLAAGQELDLNGGSDELGLAGINQKNWLKTGALFAATAEMAAVLDGKTEQQRLALADFAFHVGSAFQTMDDYLDSTAQSSVVGKDTGKDVDKDTIASKLGPAQARLTYLEHLRLAHAVLPECAIREDMARLMLHMVFSAAPAEPLPA